MAASYTFEDFSGATASGTVSDNPFQDVIDSCQNDPTQIQARYSTHRTKRNQQQRAKLLAPDFPGVTVDEILMKLEHPELYPGFEDPRFCLTVWARPTAHVRSVIAEIQRRLLLSAPNLWVMPPPNLHMTALEVTHSVTAAEIEQLVGKLLPHAASVTDFTLAHRARLVKPLVSFDAQALAISFLPADGEPGTEGSPNDDTYTYHHLRRDVFSMVQDAGVTVGSRYVIPSAHLTIGRFVTTKDFESNDGRLDREKIQKLIDTIDDINHWLETEYWPRASLIPPGGEWIVGAEQGLEMRRGQLWYGDGGEMVRRGKGF